MELTKEQILKVEDYLKKKNFEFIDLKIEILDHIISDIESLLTENNSFENAYKKTTLKWDKHFKATSSFYFGMQYSESKIVVNKAVKLFKPFYFIYLASYFFPLILLEFFKFQFNERVVGIINNFFFFTSVISVIYLGIIIFKTKKTKIKTTYSFILKIQYLAISFFFIILFTRNFFNKEGELIPILLGFAFAGFSVVFSCYYFFKKHKEAIKKHRIS